MTSLLLFVALLCNPQLDQEIAIAIAVNAPQPEQQSVVVEAAKPEPQYTTRQVTKYRTEWRQRCNGGRCQRYRVRVPYTVTERVPVSGQAWPSYPTSPRAREWRQNGHNVTWQHLTQGIHAKHNFDPAWLKSRTRAELEQLHSHSHTGQIDTRFIVTRK